MAIRTIPFGAPLDVHWSSDIDSLSLTGGNLRVRIARSVDSHEVIHGLDVFFEAPTGFRYLDELDLARYWTSSSFTRGFHVLKIAGGGWSDEENALQGSASNRKEWLVITGNGCLSVFSATAPTLSSTTWRKDVPAGRSSGLD